MQPMFEMPDNAISHLQTEIAKYRIQNSVQRNDLAGIHIISNLPAYAASAFQCPNTFSNHVSLLSNVIVHAQSRFVRFPDVVRRRCNYKLQCLVRNLLQQFETTSREHDCASRFVKNVEHPNRFHVPSFIVCNALLQVSELYKKRRAPSFPKAPFIFSMAISRILYG